MPEIPADVEAIAEVLAAHSVEDYSEGEFDGDASLLCACHFVARGSDLYDAGIHHRAHIAEQIAASPALATLRAHERATALRETADLPIPLGVQNVKAWLRDRADRQEPT